MHLSDSIDDHIAQYGGAAAESLGAYFGKAELDVAELDTVLRERLGNGVEPYFVSTLVRGLGGSTSDVDIIAVSNNEASTMSSMLFWNGKRVGLKVITRNGLQSALCDLAERADRAAEETLALHSEKFGSASIKIADLERIIHGYSVKQGAPNIAHLKLLAVVTLFGMFRRATETLITARWANTANQPNKLVGYLTLYSTHIADALLAYYGNVQSNTKWTLQRWANFRDTNHDIIDSDVFQRLDKLTEMLARFTVQELTDADRAALFFMLDDLHSACKRLIGSEGPQPRRLVLSKDVHRFPFMPGADCLVGAGPCVVVDQRRLDGLLDLQTEPLENLDTASASLALALLATDRLRFGEAEEPSLSVGAMQ